MILEAAGRREEALSALSKALEYPRAFPQRSEVEQMLARLQNES